MSTCEDEEMKDFGDNEGNLRKRKGFEMFKGGDRSQQALDRDEKFGERELQDFGMKDKLEKVKILVGRSVEEGKVLLVVKSLKIIKKNVEGILRDLDGIV